MQYILSLTGNQLAGQVVYPICYTQLNIIRLNILPDETIKLRARVALFCGHMFYANCQTFYSSSVSSQTCPNCRDSLEIIGYGCLSKPTALPIRIITVVPTLKEVLDNAVPLTKPLLNYIGAFKYCGACREITINYLIRCLVLLFNKPDSEWKEVSSVFDAIRANSGYIQDFQQFLRTYRTELLAKQLWDCINCHPEKDNCYVYFYYYRMRNPILIELFSSGESRIREITGEEVDDNK